MTASNIEVKMEGSSKASVVPVRRMSVSASLVGKASAGSDKNRPKEPKKTG